MPIGSPPLGVRFKEALECLRPGKWPELHRRWGVGSPPSEVPPFGSCFGPGPGRTQHQHKLWNLMDLKKEMKIGIDFVKGCVILYLRLRLLPVPVRNCHKEEVDHLGVEWCIVVVHSSLNYSIVWKRNYFVRYSKWSIRNILVYSLIVNL